MFDLTDQSFGRKTPPVLCPCGTGIEYRSCCHPIHQNPSSAGTPEALMRARYSAFTLLKDAFLLSTWMRDTRPDELTCDPHIVWLSLKILDTGYSDRAKKSGFVLFRATFIEAGQKCILEESSRFISISNRWYYLDGDPRLDSKPISSNEPCPCGSGRKFKRCCKN